MGSVLNHNKGLKTMTFGGNTRSNIIKRLSIKMLVTLYSSNIYFKFACLENSA